MTENDLISWVLLQINIFFFLQEFDHYRLTGDQNSQRVMARFANERNLGDIFERSQLMQLKTGLGILLPIFAYSARVNSNIWDEVGFSIAPHYKCVTYDKDDEICDLDTNLFLRIIRNALAHYSDFIMDENTPTTIHFDTGIIEFKTRDGKIIFSDEGGYIHFLSDFLRATKAVIRKRIASFKADT